MSKLEVIDGSMYSGKSEVLIRRLRTDQYGKRRILVLKPHIDRNQEPFIGTRLIVDGKSVTVAQLPAKIIASEKDFVDAVAADFDTLGIDEAQFFGKWLPVRIKELMQARDIRIIVSGLDLDAWRRPFGPMPAIREMADEVDTLRAVCFSCGNPAMYTQILGGTGQQKQPGDIELYEARCWRCHTIPK